MSTKELLNKNFQAIQTQIQEATSSAERPADSVKLVAVTKTVPTDTMRDLFALGMKTFGENRTDVLVKKQAELADLTDIEWHFIGNLQSRQVKSIINSIDYLHSLDRLSLAKEIQKRAEETVKCFVQVNVSGETSKSGFEPSELESTLEQLAAYDKIQVIGLMTMAPIDATEAELHQYFKQLKELQTSIAAQKLTHAPCTDVSMGMSQDYPIAIAEGATFIRVGSAFFQE